MMRTPYEVLGIREGATVDEIKRAYRAKAKECHPDLHPEDPKANEKMQEINLAYDMLSNPARYAGQRQTASRAQHGGSGHAQRPRGSYSGQGWDGSWQYTYYADTGRSRARENRREYGVYNDAWNRRSARAIRPFRSAMRLVGGILLFRCFTSLLRLLFFGFFW